MESEFDPIMFIFFDKIKSQFPLYPVTPILLIFHKNATLGDVSATLGDILSVHTTVRAKSSTDVINIVLQHLETFAALTSLVFFSINRDRHIIYTAKVS